MRKLWAKIITLLTAVLVFLLSIIFAIQQNPHQSPTLDIEAEKSITSTGTLSESDTGETIAAINGRKVFETQNCMRCHSIAGKGNPRNPLDDVGKHLTAKAIRQWIQADNELKDKLSTHVFLAKQTYRNLPDKDMDALVNYLQRLQPVIIK